MLSDSTLPLRKPPGVGVTELAGQRLELLGFLLLTKLSHLVMRSEVIGRDFD